MMAKTMVTFTSRQVEVGPLALAGELALSENATALVMFVHGSGSSRFSPRHREVAAVFQRRGMATLLFDLLSEAEACDRHKVFDIALLARRVEQAVDWVAQQPQTARMRIGLFGASTGAAAALVAAVAAVARPGRVLAVVSRGGRPDLATDWLPRVDVPTLLIVGSADPDVLAINRAAFRLLHCIRRIEVVPGATHLFEEPAALQSVAELAADWFESYLGYGRPA